MFSDFPEFSYKKRIFHQFVKFAALVNSFPAMLVNIQIHAKPISHTNYDIAIVTVYIET